MKTAWLALTAAAAIWAQATVTGEYRDPKGRLTLQVPADWNKFQMNDDGVQFSHSGAFVTMVVIPSADLDLVLQSMVASNAGIWKNFKQELEGAATFGGLVGKYVTCSGTSPLGADSYIEILAATDRQWTYVLLTQASKTDYMRLKPVFDQIERSFTRTAVSGPPPAPAPAMATPKAAPPPAATPTAGANSPKAYRMKLHTIADEHSFEQPMTAMSLLVPVDWQFQGQVQYGQGAGCHPDIVKLQFRASSPDGRLAIEMFPGKTWQWTDDANMRNAMEQSNRQMARFGAHPCDILQPMSADAYLRRYVLPAVRRGARVEGSEPLPDANPRLQQEARDLEQQAAHAGMRATIRPDAGRVRVSYPQGSQSVEEWFTAMTFSIGMPGPSFNVRTGRAGQVLYYTNTADHIYGMRAPAGQLEAAQELFQLILGTVKVNPQWQARVVEAINTLNQQDQQAANQRSAIITKAGQDIARMNQEAFENAQNARDHSMAAWSQYMRGVQSFRNPVTGETVELSNEYGNAWAGPDNTYVLSSSSLYNPNSDSSLDGHYTRLEPVKP